MESIELAAIRNEVRPLLFKDLPDCPVGPLGMGMHLGVSDAFVDEPGVHLVVGFEPQPRREEALADKPDLVLHLTLFPARRRRACDRLDQMMRTHLEKAAIVLALFADED